MALQAFNIPEKTAAAAPNPRRRLDDRDFDEAWRTSKRLKRESDEYNLAGCLVMLSNGGAGAGVDLKKQLVESSDPKASDKNVHRYTCGVCGKGFPSYQALGGHKASHREKAMSSAGAAKQEEQLTASMSTSAAAKFGGRLHQCKTCGKNYPTGQALGGHKRKHYEGVINRTGSAKNGINSSEGAGATSGVTSSDGGGGGDASQSHSEATLVHRSFDLNMPAPAELDLTLSLCGF